MLPAAAAGASCTQGRHMLPWGLQGLHGLHPRWCRLSGPDLELRPCCAAAEKDAGRTAGHKRSPTGRAAANAPAAHPKQQQRPQRQRQRDQHPRSPGQQQQQKQRRQRQQHEGQRDTAAAWQALQRLQAGAGAGDSSSAANEADARRLLAPLGLAQLLELHSAAAAAAAAPVEAAAAAQGSAAAGGTGDAGGAGECSSLSDDAAVALVREVAARLAAVTPRELRSLEAPQRRRRQQQGQEGPPGSLALSAAAFERLLHPLSSHVPAGQQQEPQNPQQQQQQQQQAADALCDLLPALALLGCRPPPAWLAAWQAATLPLLPQASGAVLSRALHAACVMLSYRPAPGWMATWQEASAAEMRGGGVGALDLASVALAVAAAGYRPAPAWLAAWWAATEAAVAERPGDATMQASSSKGSSSSSGERDADGDTTVAVTLARAAATARWQPPASWRAAVGAAAGRELAGLPPQRLPGALWAVARAGCALGPEAAGALADLVVQARPLQQQQQRRRQKGEPAQAPAATAAGKEERSLLQAAAPRDASLMVWALVQLGAPLSGAWLAAVEAQTAPLLASWPVAQIETLARAFVEGRHRPGAAWANAFAAAAAPQLEPLSLIELSNLAVLAARLRLRPAGRPGARWEGCLLAATGWHLLAIARGVSPKAAAAAVEGGIGGGRAPLGRREADAIASLGWALAEVGLCPPRPWRRWWEGAVAAAVPVMSPAAAVSALAAMARWTALPTSERGMWLAPLQNAEAEASKAPAVAIDAKPPPAAAPVVVAAAASSTLAAGLAARPVLKPPRRLAPAQQPQQQQRPPPALNPADLHRRLLEHLGPRMAACSGPLIASALAALQPLRLRPGPDWLDAAYDQLLDRRAELAPGAVIGALEAATALQHPLAPRRIDALLRQAAQGWGTAPPALIARAAAAVAAADHEPAPEWVAGLAAAAAASLRAAPHAWGSMRLVAFMGTLAALEPPPEARAPIAALRAAARPLLPRLPPRQLAALLTATAALPGRPGHAAAHALALQLWRSMQRMRPGALAAAGVTFARMGAPLGRAWCARYLACARAVVQSSAARCTAREQGDLMWAAQYALRGNRGARGRGPKQRGAAGSGGRMGLPAVAGLAARLQRAQALRKRTAQRRRERLCSVQQPPPADAPAAAGHSQKPFHANRSHNRHARLTRPLGLFAWAYRRRLAAICHSHGAATPVPRRKAASRESSRR